MILLDEYMISLNRYAQLREWAISRNESPRSTPPLSALRSYRLVKGEGGNYVSRQVYVIVYFRPLAAIDDVDPVVDNRREEVIVEMHHVAAYACTEQSVRRDHAPLPGVSPP